MFVYEQMYVCFYFRGIEDVEDEIGGLKSQTVLAPCLCMIAYMLPGAQF